MLARRSLADRTADIRESTARSWDGATCPRRRRHCRRLAWGWRYYASLSTPERYRRANASGQVEIDNSMTPVTLDIAPARTTGAHAARRDATLEVAIRPGEQTTKTLD
jgi:hypothetical protein